MRGMKKIKIKITIKKKKAKKEEEEPILGATSKIEILPPGTTIVMELIVLIMSEEIAELRDNLRKAELRHVAAEATAASVLQRARAAELSRDVKEIQIRNLEIRLARAALDRFRHGCFMLGAKAARAGGGAMSAAAAVASEATKEAVHSATVTVGGGGRRDAAGDQFSQGEVDGGIVEEYWGSDYCTSV
eukprot:g12934.t1